MIFLSYPICAFLIISLVNIIFFSKKRVDTYETKNYRKLIIVNFVESIFALLGLVCIKFFMDSLFSRILIKIDYALLLLWGSLLFRYIIAVAISDEKRLSHITRFIIGINIILSIIILVLPVNIIFTPTSIDSKGLSTNFMFFSIAVYLIGIIIFVIKIIFDKSIKDKARKLTPLISLVLLIIFLIAIKAVTPEIIIQGVVLSLVSLIMFFTIENPDLKMISKLEYAYQTAEKANNAKSDFLSSMSHEIRTPLNAIVGLSEDIMNYKDNLPNEVYEDAEDIVNASKTLLEIVGNILDINKIESDKMEIVELPYNFKKEISEMVRVTTTRIGDKPIDFTLNMALDLPDELIGDKTHVKGIINNLLTNAIKYTESGSIELSIKCINNDEICTLIISVMDTGNGIKSEDINKLFTKFERLDVEKNTTTEGTGLGLAITKRLVEMMNGKINVQSKYGEGSLFVVQLPQKISRRESLSNTQIISQKAINNRIMQEYNGKKVLIVDDNKLNIKVAKKALASFNMDLDEAYTGQECLDKIKVGAKYDLILMDIMMPVMSGSTALKHLKEIPNFNTPVVALTADALAGAEKTYKNEGFVSYIAKPFSKDEIEEKLAEIFLSH